MIVNLFFFRARLVIDRDAKRVWICQRFLPWKHREGEGYDFFKRTYDLTQFGTAIVERYWEPTTKNRAPYCRIRLADREGRSLIIGKCGESMVGEALEIGAKISAFTSIPLIKSTRGEFAPSNIPLV